jgi:hypothetical protein
MPTRSPASPNPASPARPSITHNQQKRLLTARPDGLDFRDQIYRPNLIEVPVYRGLDLYRRAAVPILDQGETSACTGFALATVAHYLLRTRVVVPDQTEVSRQMFYDLARRYDEWKGLDTEGSSCRGAMKGWYKHGICARELWPDANAHRGILTDPIVQDAARRTLGAYFRVNHRSLVDMHTALTETGILYASATVHGGWSKAGGDGIIPNQPDLAGGHAFAIVGYDDQGFWLQNSWGQGWGKDGYGHLSYEDWLANGTDVWVARLGAPSIAPSQPLGQATAAAGAVRAGAFQFNDIRPHVISIGNNGKLDPQGDIGTSTDMVDHMLNTDFDTITKGWQKKRLVLYAHGGLTAQESALQHVAEARAPMLAAQCYPLAFIWHSDYLTTLRDILADAVRQRRPEGALDNLKDFMLDRLDDALEPIARIASGMAEWSKMKENALDASADNGGAQRVADDLAALADKPEIHLVGHSAGAVFHAGLLPYLISKGLTVASCTLWAPACTVELFKKQYLPALKSGALKKLIIYTLTDKAEQDDNCAEIYHKSLLYLVSNAFEEHHRNPFTNSDGEPILGMQKFLESLVQDQDVLALTQDGKFEWILSPNTEPPGSLKESTATHHGDFDDDEATRRSTLARIVGSAPAAAPQASAQGFAFAATPRAQAKLRHRLDQATTLRGQS